MKQTVNNWQSVEHNCGGTSLPDSVAVKEKKSRLNGFLLMERQKAMLPLMVSLLARVLAVVALVVAAALAATRLAATRLAAKRPDNKNPIQAPGKA